MGLALHSVRPRFARPDFVPRQSHLGVLRIGNEVHRSSVTFLGEATGVGKLSDAGHARLLRISRTALYQRVERARQRIQGLA